VADGTRMPGTQTAANAEALAGGGVVILSGWWRSRSSVREHSRAPPGPPKAPMDHPALEATIENKIVTGSVALGNVRAVSARPSPGLRPRTQ
jgi:hypothetical protein